MRIEAIGGVVRGRSSGTTRSGVNPAKYLAVRRKHLLAFEAELDAIGRAPLRERETDAQQPVAYERVCECREDGRRERNLAAERAPGPLAPVPAARRTAAVECGFDVHGAVLDPHAELLGGDTRRFDLDHQLTVFLVHVAAEQHAASPRAPCGAAAVPRRRDDASRRNAARGARRRVRA